MASANPAADSVLLEVVERARRSRKGDDAADVEAFLRAYWRRVPPGDLLAREPVDLLGAALAHVRLALQRDGSAVAVRVYAPTVGDDGWQSPHTIVDCVLRDLPFAVDSIALAVERTGRTIHLVVDPVIDDVSYVHVEVDRVADDGAAATLQMEVERALAAVQLAVDDWPAMRGKAIELAGRLENGVEGHDALDTAEVAALLRWLADDHFVFLGHQDIGGSSLGVLRDEPSDLDDDPPGLFWTTKTAETSIVHRAESMDQIDILDADRFVGLFTQRVYKESVRNIPMVRHKVAAVLAMAAYEPGSHGAGRLLAILEGHPRDELFQATVTELHEAATGLLSIRERQAVRLFVRVDPFGRFASCLVYVPRERFSTQARQRIRTLLVDALGGSSSTFTTELSASSHARLHVMVAAPAAGRPRDLDALEERIARVTRDWAEDLRQALIDRVGEDRGLALVARFGAAFPAGYRDEVAPTASVDDVLRLDELLERSAETGGPAISVGVHQAAEADDGDLRLRIYRTGEPISLSAALPLLKERGITVLDGVPTELALDGEAAWIYDFGLCLPADAVDDPPMRRRFEDAFLAVWSGRAESDGLGRLVLSAGLNWREVALLRALRQYLRQSGSPFSQGYLDEVLTGAPQISSLAVRLFQARFDPDAGPGGDPQRADALRLDLETELAKVASLDEDRILRSLRALVEATVRTSWYQVDTQGQPLVHTVLKLDPTQVADLPLPRPRHEIFVYAPHTEGVHLRMGRIARGGLRWSDRKEDYRTEVLGLVKAQTVKNAVIVPVGAKGGFVARLLPAGDRAALQAEVVRCYRTFVGGMLDVTDNLVDGQVVPPARTVRHDGDDSYLVVAADKGTATFSDIANGISVERGFWLGDAFASGGSAGYDHKAMGITARGAWESVRFHFRQVGVDVDSQPTTVVGIGDMSGDVFGNGMLLSRHLRLVAAFDHRHVFLDPNPDPERSYAERERLFGLPSSSWADYDPALISEGGGVFARTTKAVEVSAQAAAVLGIEAGVLTPAQLISAVLRAPVDLLWNGGIGTYVRASSETNDDAADRANDAVRASADQLRCKVVGEGGNLGFTQRARIEAARRGVLVNTDAIDNSAGVDCSDHEVNLKILLDQVVRSGDLTTKQRNELLASMTDDVAALVLGDNRAQNVALAAARTQAPGMVDVHIRHLAWLEQAAGLDRDIEELPSDDELLGREEVGEGLTQPELAVLLAYTKINLASELLRSDLPDDGCFADELPAYFPAAVQERYGDRLVEHPLRRELISTQVTNRLVNRAGISMTHRLQEETSAEVADIARAHQAAWEVFALREPWERVDRLDGVVAAAVQIQCVLEIKKLGERATRWFLRNRRTPLDVDANVRLLGPDVAQVGGVLPIDEEAAARLVAADVPADLARRVASMPLVITALDIVDLAQNRQRPLDQVAAAYFEVDERLGLGWLRSRITLLARGDRWQALARSALRDDFFAEHKHLVDQVLASGASVDRWVAANRVLVERGTRLLADLRSGGGPVALAQLSVALRELRNLTHQSASP